MTSYRLFLLADCVAFGLFAGCATTAFRQDQPAGVEQVWLANIDKSQAVHVAQDVLAEMYFTIEKADLDSGLIRTGPLSGAQFFEFWRSDNSGLFNAALANLHSIRRTAEVQVQPQGDRVLIRCDVRIQKLSLPEHGPIGSPGAPLRRLSLGPEQGKSVTWIDLGNDPELAGEILRRVSSRL